MADRRDGQKKNFGTITCKACGNECAKRGPIQIYCEACSEEADRKRKKTWAERNPLTKAQVAQIMENRRNASTAVLQAWNKKNANLARGISWFGDPESEPDLAWVIRVKVPFLYRMSKNAIFATNRFGHVALRREAKAVRHEITAIVKESISRLIEEGVEVKSHKLWIDLLVQKPNHRGDAINVLDLVCDAIKDAVGIDDRWFAIRRIDWEIVKDKPYVFIGIGQEEVEHSRVCSACGQILEMAAFTRNSANKEGFGRVCRECLRLQRRVESRSRRALRGQQLLPLGSRNALPSDREALL